MHGNSSDELTGAQRPAVTFWHGPKTGRNGLGASSDSHVCDQGVANMKNLVSRFVKDESGATAIEYGLIAAGISVAIIAVVQGLGTQLKTTFTSITTALSTASK